MMTTGAPTLPLWQRLLGPYLAVLSRLVLGAVFIAAAWPKVRDPLGFANSIANYHMVPTSLINLLAIALPMIEAVAGVALVLGLSTRANLLIVDALLALFIVAIALAMSRGLDISCGCFSAATADSAKMTRTTLLWDIVWLAMGIHALLFDRGLLSLGALLRRRQPPPSEPTPSEPTPSEPTSEPTPN